MLFNTIMKMFHCCYSLVRVILALTTLLIFLLGISISLAAVSTVAYEVKGGLT